MTDYISGVEYIDGEMSSVYLEEGRAAKVEGNWRMEYVIRDHLGNTRVAFVDLNGDNRISSKLEDGELLQEHHYYPFGMGWESSSNVPWERHPKTEDGLNNKYTYNGKEVHDEVLFEVDGVEVSLGYLDYGARFYDPSIGRWGQVDPLADAYASYSPYNYVLNNPLIYIDPDGMRVDPSNLLNSESQELIDAFNLFSRSEAGIALLSKFAQKGQTIGGHTFEADGEFHAQGINLSFSASGFNDKETGSTNSVNGYTFSNVGDDGGMEVGVVINSDLNGARNDAAFEYSNNPNEQTKSEYVNSRMGTIFHETSIHAEGNATDYTQDCQLNCSNIPDHYGLDSSLKTNRNQIQHKNAKRSGSVYRTQIIPTIISISKANGSKSSSSEISKRILNFSN